MIIVKSTPPQAPQSTTSTTPTPQPSAANSDQLSADAIKIQKVGDQVDEVSFHALLISSSPEPRFHHHHHHTQQFCHHPLLWKILPKLKELEHTVTNPSIPTTTKKEAARELDKYTEFLTQRILQLDAVEGQAERPLRKQQVNRIHDIQKWIDKIKSSL